MTGQRDGSADLCHLTEAIEAFNATYGYASGSPESLVAHRRRRLQQQAATGNNKRALGGGKLLRAGGGDTTVAARVRRRRLASAEPAAGADTHSVESEVEETLHMLQGYVGLFGGTSCAHYTIEAEFMASNSSCSTETTGTCSKGRSS